jgi:tetratricopeptide (TPR) repeat protein
MLPTASRDTGGPAVLGERYEILSPLGSGSMASVFKVRDRRDESFRAAKVLAPENAAQPEILARFEDEFRILRTLHHPHLPEVTDYGWTKEGGRYLIMELVEGESLDQYFRTRPDDIWVMLYQLCEALTFVHSKNLLHQDIKPSNILVTRTRAYGSEMPLVKLIDFGLTYRRDTGAAVQLVGTPAYVAPEVVQGEAPLTRAVDYYSLGATLYELLCGAPPFTGTTTEVLRAQVEREPVIEDEHIEWAELYPHVRALLTKDKRARLEAFEEFRRAIVSRLTGGIDELDKAYGLARIESLPMIGKDEVWKEMMGWLEGMVRSEPSIARVLLLRGASGVGKSLLMDRFDAECAAAGVVLWRLGSRSEYQWLVQSDVGNSTGRFDTYARAWRRLKGVAHTRPIALVIESDQDLDEDEASLVRFAITQFELVDAQREGLRIYMVVVPKETVQQFINLDLLGVLEIGVPSLTADTCALIVRTFRGELTDSADARALDRVLGTAVDIRSVIRTLAHAATTGSLVFSRGRWTLRGRILSNNGRVEHRDLKQALSLSNDLPFDILAHLACHNRPLPVTLLSVLIGIGPDVIRKEIGSLRRQELVQETVCDGKPAIDGSERVKLAVLKSLPARQKQMIHARFLRLLYESCSRDRLAPELGLSLAHHHDAIGQDRQGSLLRIRVIRSARDRRDFAAIESLAETVVRRGAPGLLHRYYLKQWIESLWARNHHARAFQVLEEQLVHRNQTIPAGMVPRYLKGMSDACGPRKALNQAGRLRLKSGMSEPVLRFQIEKAFLLSALGFNRKAISELHNVLAKEDTLSARDRHRARIYLSMNLLAVGQLRLAAEVLNGVMARALSHGCVDEHVLASTVRAQMLAMQGDPRNVLRLCASGIRFARDNGLDFRRNVLYRLAASAYHDLGDRRRARQYQEQATRLASALDMHEFEAMSWARLAHYEASAGSYGNALRYVDKALAVIGEGSTRSHRVQAETLRLWLHVWLRTTQVPMYLMAARRRVDGITNVNEKGRLCLVMAQGQTERSDFTRAEKLCNQALACFRKSGFVDNQVSVLRAQMKLRLRCGNMRSAGEIYRRVRDLRRVVTSQNAMMECRMVALEYHLLLRAAEHVIHRELVACESLCGDKVDVSLQFDALVLMFRARARQGDVKSADSLFGRITEAVRNVAANVGVANAAGLSERLELDRLTDEMWLVRRNERGRAKRRPRS